MNGPVNGDDVTPGEGDSVVDFYANRGPVELTEDEQVSWKLQFGQYANDPEDLTLPNEETAEPTPGEFCVGMAFLNKQAFKNNLREYCVLEHSVFKLRKSEPHRVYADCYYKESHGCMWKVTARKLLDENTFTIRETNLVHTCNGCEEPNKNKKCNSEFVAEHLKKTMKPCEEIPKPRQICDYLIWGDLNVEIPYWLPCQHAVCALVRFRPNWAK